MKIKGDERAEQIPKMGITGLSCVWAKGFFAQLYMSISIAEIKEKSRGFKKKSQKQIPACGRQAGLTPQAAPQA